MLRTVECYRARGGVEDRERARQLHRFLQNDLREYLTLQERDRLRDIGRELGVIPAGLYTGGASGPRKTHATDVLDVITD